MSTLTVSNVSDGSLSIPTTYVTNGSAKAWVNFNGTGTIAERNSFNVSSLTDDGTGEYDVNLTTALTDVNGSAVSGVSEGSRGFNRGANPEIATTSSLEITTFSTSTNAKVDMAFVMASVFGDLA